MVADRYAFRSSPPPSLDEEVGIFEQLQRTLADRWIRVRDIDSGPRDIVVIPSLSLEGLPMSNIPGITHYEERMLFALMLLQHPRAHLVYVTSEPLHPGFVDYLVSMVHSVPAAHVRDRLTLLSTFDASPRPLTAKILERPRLIERVRRAIAVDNAHMTCFTVSPLERSLAVRLGIPLYGVDPDLLELGTKSGSRHAFREAGIPHPPGAEGIRDEQDVAAAVTDLWATDPALERVVIKHDHGFSGEGNAVLELGPLAGAHPQRASRPQCIGEIRRALPYMRFCDESEQWPHFHDELQRLGGVVEAFIEGRTKRSPSAQLRINPRSELEAISTHDQLLGGRGGQSYQGCRFPADEAYRLAIQGDALRVGEVLVRKGVLGRIAVDFVAVERESEPGRWDHYAIEINLRMTGTTHPLMFLRMLDAGRYDVETGLYFNRRGDPRYYLATDTLYSPSYRGLLVEDLLDIAAVHELHYRPWTDTGVVFHLVGALSQFGKLGITAIGGSPSEAKGWFDAVRETLNRETTMSGEPSPDPAGGSR